VIDRRGALGRLGALAAAPLAATADAKPVRKPPCLNPGDTVGLVSPASAVGTDDGLDRADYWIRSMGLVPKFGPHAGDRDGYLAGTDANRAADFNAMVADSQVKAIFAVRGGWGAARILPLIDWNAVRSDPKLLIGYSDVTALHLAYAKEAGFATIHGGNATSSWRPQSWESLWQLAFAGARPVLGGTEGEAATGRAGRTIHGGKARGRLLGGNMTIVSTLMGTPWMPSFKGAVLFIEDVNEAEYRVDRMFQQLRLAGALDGLAGVVFGQCTSCATTAPDYDGFTIDQIVDQYLGPLGIPSFTGANVGHVSNQLSLPSGAEVELDANARTIRLLQPIVG
jgi:muramoyltetrapeptide carboxypeptidase